MFVMMNRMNVPDSHREQFEQAFATRAMAVDRRPGFIRAEILRPKEGNEYIVVTHWESEESFLGWVDSPEFREGHKRVGQFRDAEGNMLLTSKVEKYEVIAE